MSSNPDTNGQSAQAFDAQPLDAHAVDWLRGTRDYVRVADVLAVAPITPAAHRIELHFHAVTNCAGRWLPSDRPEDVEPGHEMVVTLKIADQGGEVARWGYVVDHSLPITRRIEDAGEEQLAATVTADGHVMTLAMTDEFNLWEHIIASAKALGGVALPDVKWYVLFVKVSLALVPPTLSGHVMTMRPGRRRRALTELMLSIDANAIGSVGVVERPD